MIDHGCILSQSFSQPCSSSSPLDDPFLQHSSIPTMHFQASLPRLPVPKLEDTCKRYLTSQQVILSREELKKTEEAVKDFCKEGGQGRSRCIVDHPTWVCVYFLYDWICTVCACDVCVRVCGGVSVCTLT